MNITPLLRLAHKDHELPGWFPYAVAASLVIALGAGIKSGWKLSGETQPPSPPPPPGPPQQAGVIHGLSDWTSGQFRI